MTFEKCNVYIMMCNSPEFDSAIANRLRAKSECCDQPSSVPQQCALADIHGLAEEEKCCRRDI